MKHCSVELHVSVHFNWAESISKDQEALLVYLEYSGVGAPKTYLELNCIICAFLPLLLHATKPCLSFLLCVVFMWQMEDVYSSSSFHPSALVCRHARKRAVRVFFPPFFLRWWGGWLCFCSSSMKKRTLFLESQAVMESQNHVMFLRNSSTLRGESNTVSAWESLNIKVKHAIMREWEPERWSIHDVDGVNSVVYWVDLSLYKHETKREDSCHVLMF